MSNFMSAAKRTWDSEYNRSVTENGAIGYKTTGKALLDLNFSVASLRNATPREIEDKFTRAFTEDPVLAVKWLFFARDIRGGLGERRLFRTVLQTMACERPDYAAPVLKLVPEYGRWDDLWCLLDTKLRNDVLKLIHDQLTEDIQNLKAGNSISLLAKWIPSVSASSATTKRYAKKICRYMGFSERDYRRAISKLRTKLDVVEQKMSDKRWGDIVYDAVPSRANLIYNAAFLRNDEQRRQEFLDKLNSGEAKINAGTLFPHDIVNRYRSSNVVDNTLEALWKSLPDTVNGCGNTIVVSDESGSMTWVNLPGSTARPLEVAEALAIYFSERSSGQFKDNFITFSTTPEIVNLSKCRSLREKINTMQSKSVACSTNIEAVFDLILRTAQNNDMSQEDIPQNVLIISDMEFDTACSVGRRRVSSTLFDVIHRKYQDAGYKLPRLVFWNVASRTGTIPMLHNDMGVALVSGFSPNIARMVMSGKLDPYDCLLESLSSDRYAPVEQALANL